MKAGSRGEEIGKVARHTLPALNTGKMKTGRRRKWRNMYTTLNTLETGDKERRKVKEHTI